MPRALIAALACLLLFVPATGRAKCAMQQLEHQVVTHAGDEIPAGGGVLVGWTTSTDWQKEHPAGDPAAQASWRLRVGKRRVATTLEVIAPGLARYRPTKLQRGKAQRHDLLGAGGTKLGTFRFGNKRRAALGPAPGLVSVAVTHSRNGRSTSVLAVASLDAAPPADAYALVLRTVGGEAFAWGIVADRTASAITVFDDNGRCDAHPPGMRAPSSGEQVEALWVDRFGRTSPASAATAARAP